MFNHKQQHQQQEMVTYGKNGIVAIQRRMLSGCQHTDLLTAMNEIQ